MPYQPNIPQPTDQLDDSQDDILKNFQEIYNLVGVNHVQFGAAAGQGKHTQVTLPENVAPANTLIDEANIYSRLSTLTAQTELVWQRENNGTRIEWTGLSATQDGWTRLPSGILLKWGQANGTGFASPYLYPVAATIPVFDPLIPNNPFITLLIALDPNPAGGSRRGVNLTSGSQTNVGFSVNTFILSGSSALPGVYNYLSIGI